MIKFISVVVIFVVLGLSTLAVADMSSCSQQSNCFEWSATEEVATICLKEDGSNCQCQFRMCVLYNQNKFGCAQTSGETPDKTCIADDSICEPPLTTSVEYQDYPTGSYQCQVVPPGGAAQFIFEDGAGCNAALGKTVANAIGGPIYGTTTSCVPNFDPTMSCGNFVPGSECLWTYNAPTFCAQYTAWACGDPHFQTWGGEKYDFHGVCDLVLMENKNFRDGVDMNIHIRTKEMKEKFSYISNAVIQIGDDTLEVAAGNDGSRGEYWINGVAGKPIHVGIEEDFDLSENIAGYPITYRRPTEKTAEFEVYLGNHDTITLKTWKDFVRVSMNGEQSNFVNSRGLMGTSEGIKIARDNFTVIEDHNEFGMEWQVLSTERHLFHSKEGPQHPQQCIIPSAANMRRRLRESRVPQNEAEEACSGVPEDEREICVFDVMATGDLEAAGAY